MDVSSFYILLLYLKKGSIQVTIPVMLIIVLFCRTRNNYRTYYAPNVFAFFGIVTTTILFMLPIFCLFSIFACLQKALVMVTHYSFFGSSTAFFDYFSSYRLSSVSQRYEHSRAVIFHTLHSIDGNYQITTLFSLW